jgi:hypothetical protein
LHKSVRISSPLRILGALLTCSSLGASALAAQSIGYSVIPTAQRVQWNDNLAFKDDWMYGGRLAIRVGDAIELQPFYFSGRKYGIDESRAPALFGPRSAGRKIDLQHYGLSVQLNIGHGALVPFLRGGGGVLRFEPDSGARQDRLAATAGGGVRFGIGELQAEVFAEQLAFRLDPRRLFGGDSTGAGTAPQQRNLVYGVAIAIPISNAPDDEEISGLRGSTAPLEPFVGRLRYAGGTGLREQNVAGIRAGIDFSSLIGLRGFYWRGVNDDRNKFVSVEGYGAEGQFNLNTGPGVSPYVLAGAARINFSGSVRDSAGRAPADKDALIVGGGLSFQLGERFRLNAAIRDYVIARNDSASTVGASSDLTHNPMLTAGMTFSVGGRTGPSDRERATERDTRTARIRDRDADVRYVRDSTRAAREDRMRDADSTRDAKQRREAKSPMGGQNGQPAVGDRWITIPVPATGEIILRYGLPATSDPARPAGAVIVRDSVIVRRDSMGGGASSDQLRAQLAELEARLSARIEAMRPMNATVEVTTARASDRMTVVSDTTDRRRGQTMSDRFRTLSSRDVQLFAGVGFGDADTQLALSGRLDLGPVMPQSNLHLYPELAFGFGGSSTAVLAMANVQYQFPTIGEKLAVRPYLTGGAGIYSPTGLAINTAFGMSVDMKMGRRMPWIGYAEVQGLNLFNDTRLLLGISMR